VDEMKKKNRQNRRQGALKRLEAVKDPKSGLQFPNERQQREIETLKKRLNV